MAGTKIVAWIPSRAAAYATAAPWFPPDAAATPAGGTVAQQQVRERSARLERARVLHELELERDGACCDAGVAPVDVEHRSLANVRPNHRLDGGDRVAVDAVAVRAQHRASSRERTPAQSARTIA